MMFSLSSGSHINGKNRHENSMSKESNSSAPWVYS